MKFWDYGNSFMLESSRAGAEILNEEDGGDETEPKFRYPSYVQDIMGDIFSLGFGPFRWVCTSGEPGDLAMTDKIALEVLTAIKDEYGAKGTENKAGSEEEQDYFSRAVPQLDDNMLWITEADEVRREILPYIYIYIIYIALP